MILSALLYYLFLLPVSILPFPVLHVISRVVYVILFHVTGYRKKVVMENIRNAFPEKSETEYAEITRRYYKHLSDLLIESLKIYTISKKQLVKRITCSNPEVIDHYHTTGNSVIMAIGHYHNWELLSARLNSILKHRVAAIYLPLNNKFFDRKMSAARSRFGTVLVPAQEVKTFYFNQSKTLHATIFAFDQTPSNPGKAYWMQFLHQDTPFMTGIEVYAKKFNLPVFYVRMKKIKHGYYQLEFVEVRFNPAKTVYGEITEQVTHLLEQDIIAQPEYWLWSHRRWKHKRVHIE